MIESFSTTRGKVLMNRRLIMKRNKASQSFANARTKQTKGTGRMKRKYKSGIIKQFHGNNNKTGKTVLFNRFSLKEKIFFFLTKPRIMKKRKRKGEEKCPVSV